MSKKSEKEEREKAEKKLKKAAKKEKKAKRKATSADPGVSPEQRQEMIATAAYYIAEHQGFTPGQTAANWQAAEKEIDKLLKKKKKKKG